VYADLKNYEQAIESYKKAIGIKPDYHEAWNNLGIVYADLKNYEQAMETFQKAIEIKPDKEEAYFNIACTYSLEKNKEKALEYLQQAITLNPKYKEDAPKEKDFEWLWGDKDFLALINSTQENVS
jgi:tetratricopeptide (TPR) repeat protein